MSFLRRLLGGGEPSAPAPPPVDATTLLDEENERDRELLKDDARRLDDELLQRQLRYADRSWTPPAQGGDRRAEDAGADDGEER
jgi:hypothetical protein